MKKPIILFLMFISTVVFLAIGCEKDNPTENGNEKYYLEMSGDVPKKVMWTTRWSIGPEFTTDDWNYNTESDDYNVIMYAKFPFDVQVGDTVVMRFMFNSLDYLMYLNFYNGDEIRRQYQITRDYILPTGYCYYRIKENDMVEIDIFK